MNSSSHLQGFEFEREVAAIYRTLGAEVQHNISLAGNQIDILVIEQTPSGSKSKAVIECKAYTRPVGVDVINSFGAICYLLKNRGIVDRGVLVSKNGFTSQARSAAQEHNVVLLEIKDLWQQVKGKEDNVKRATIKEEDKVETSLGPKRVFAIMPFTREFDDIYILGVREVAENLGLIVERADSIEHNEQILEVIQDRIQSSNIVIADTTYQNPNVFYEIGYSHASNKPTVLLTRAGQEVPFDLRTINQIFYDTIVDLREKLTKRLKSMIKEIQ